MATTTKTGTPLGIVLAASGGTLIVRVDDDDLAGLAEGDELMLVKRADPIGDQRRAVAKRFRRWMG